jgi:PAS domain S-box-containing protein
MKTKQKNKRIKEQHTNINELAELHWRIEDLQTEAAKRKKAEDALQVSETRYRRLFETAQDGILLLNADTGQILDVNPFLTKMMRYSHKYFLRKKLWEIGPFKDVAASRLRFSELQTKGYVRYEHLPVQSRDGRLIDVEFVSNVYLVDHERIIQCNVRDITLRKHAERELEKARNELELRVEQRTSELSRMTGQMMQEIVERKKAERGLIKSNAQLHDLFWHLRSVREEERARLARDLHDGLGQELTALKIDLSLTGKLYKDHKPINKKIAVMIKQIDATIGTVKRVCTELRPSLLDHLGIGAAIEWQMTEFEKRTGMQCSVYIKPKGIILDQEVSIAVFRILQELLTNVVRHAQATKIRCALEKKKDMVTLHFVDNGRGITQKQISKPRSFGLMGIRERVNYFNGKLEIKGIHGKGTSIIVSIPLHKNNKLKGKNFSKDTPRRNFL